MRDFDESPIDTNICAKVHEVSDRPQRPSEEISRGNVCEQSVIFDQGDRVHRYEELVFYGCSC